MKLLLKLEDAAKFLVAFIASIYFGKTWWLFFAWLLTPDISMIGYAINARIGAITYNIAHHQGLALAVFVLGIYLNNSDVTFAGIILFGHSAFDRVMGYGLKFSDDFKHTHLGWIGKK